MERYEFMSAAWIEMARREITRALADKDLSGIQYTLCEEFTQPPPQLRGSGDTIGFCVRVNNGRVEVGDHPTSDADLKIINEYSDAIVVARDPDVAAADPEVVQERLESGRLRILGDPAGIPTVLRETDIHRLLAPHTA
jgi:hypothetical protein